MLNPAGGEASASPPFSLDPFGIVSTADSIRLSIASAVARNLRALKVCKAHTLRMSIVAGGPSANDTVDEIGGYVATINKSHDWLLEKGKRVHALGIVDPVPWMAHYITPNPNVTYFVASQAHPHVFDKLEGHKVVLWHAGQGEQVRIDDLLPPGSVILPGGTSMAMRWLDVGYALGFRAFDFHGFDCSHRKNGQHHAYEFKQDDGLETESIDGYFTWPGWLMQINDFFLRMEWFSRDKEMDRVEVRLHGDGLLQHMWKQRTGSLTYRT